MAESEQLKLSGADSFLSNFAPYPITLRNKTWPTSEHYFQAQKFLGSEIEDLIRDAQSPAEAKAIGKRHQLKRSNWNEIKELIMYEALLAKFSQHKELKAKLLDTGTQQTFIC